MESALMHTKSDVQRLMATRRVRVAIPIAISGKDKNGQAFKENTRTIVATRRGVLIRSLHDLTLGVEITVENPALQRRSCGRVIWSSSGDACTTQAKEVGLYLPDVEQICDIRFPAEGGASAPAFEPVPEATQAAAAPTPVVPVSEGLPASAIDHVSTLAEAGSEGAEGQAPASPRPVEPNPVLVVREKVHDSTNTEGEPSRPGPSMADTLSNAPAVATDKLNMALENALAQFEAKLGETTPAHLRQCEEKLNELATQIASQTWSSLRDSTARLADSVMGSFERQFGALGDRLQGSRAEAEAILTQLEELEQRSQSSLQESAARLEQNLVETLEQRAGSLDHRLQNTRTEVQAALTRLEELQQAARAEVDRTQQVIGEVSSQALQFAFEGVSEHFRTDIESLISSLLQGAREQVEHEGEGFIQAFVKGQYQDHLQQTLTEWRERARRDFEADLEKVLAKQSQDVFRMLEQELESLGARARAQVQNDCQQAVQAASDLLSQQVCSATNLLQEQERQAAERLVAHTRTIEASAAAAAENLRKQPEIVSAAALERVQQSSERLTEHFCNRLRENAEILESGALDSLQAKAQKMADELSDASAAQLRQFSEDNWELFKEQLIESQNQAMSDTTEILRKAASDAAQDSATNWRRLVDNHLHDVEEQLEIRKQLFVRGIESAFRQKIGEILTLVMNGAANAALSHEIFVPAETSRE